MGKWASTDGVIARSVGRVLTERSVWLLLGVSVVAVLAFALLLSVFFWPGADDWCFGADPLDPIARANQLYFTWSGRWLSMMAMAAATHVVDLTDPKYQLLGPVLSFPIWLAGFYFIALQTGSTRRSALGWAALLLAIFYVASPRPLEVFYWIPGVIVYAPPFALVAGGLLLMRRGRYGLASLCMALAPLFNELSCLVALPFVALFVRRDRRAWWPAAALIAGFLFVVLAPGNNVRLEHLPRPSLFLLGWAVLRPYLSPIAILADPRLWALAALLLALPGTAGERKGWRFIPVAALLSLFGSALAVVWAASTTLEPRVQSFLLAMMMGALFVVAYRLRGAIDSAIVRVGALLSLALLLPTSTTVTSALQVMPQSIANRQHYADYYAGLRAQAGRDVVAGPLGITPLGFAALSADPKDPINVCMADYLGLRSVRGADGAN